MYSFFNKRLFVTMGKFFGFNAIGCLCLHMRRKAWMKELVSSGDKSAVEKDQTTSVVTDERLGKALKSISQWIQASKQEEIIKHEVGAFLWLWMRPFTALLYGIDPELRRLGALHYPV
eukprot:m.170383 g.170383  ORF g.170383 m.170383 type:complete len:118 (+) comp39041_c0_seq1:221-574(+)